MSDKMLRQWFIPGDGIDRHVISTDIQRYLGNDATVRPGVGSNEHAGVNGYWIKAYRTLTGPMIEDLKADTNRWRQEQRTTTNRGSQSPYYKADVSGKYVPDPYSEPYISSDTYRQRDAGRPPRRGTESPLGDSPYGMPGGRDRINPQDVHTRMAIDPPGAPAGRPYGQERATYPLPNPAYGDNRGYQNDPRGQYSVDPSMQPGYNRGQGNQPYQQDPRYAPGYPQPNDNVPTPGYQRGPNSFGGYVPVNSPYDPNPSMAANRSESNIPYGSGPYQQPPQGQDPNRGYRPPQDYPAEPRYSYPSPAATTVGPSNSREPITSPPQQSPSYPGTTTSGYPPYNDRRGGQYRA